MQNPIAQLPTAVVAQKERHSYGFAIVKISAVVMVVCCLALDGFCLPPLISDGVGETSFA